MGRKRCKRVPLTALPPRGMRPLLVPQQLKDLALAHLVNLDAIARGDGTAEILWHTVGGVLTWQRVADRLQLLVEQMQAQHDLATRLVARWASTGQVVFTGQEYALAVEGVDVMDALAARVDRATAIAAAEWAEARTNQLAAVHRERAAA